jgi:hypothetical protein
MATEGKEYAEIHSNFPLEFGNRAFQKMVVYKWIILARCGKSTQKMPQDASEPRNNVNDDAIRRAIDDDPYLSCNALVYILNIGTDTVWRHNTQSMRLTYVVTDPLARLVL